MVTTVTDTQTVAETTATLFTLVQASPVDASIIIKNSGVNTINYTFQEFTNGAWADMGAVGSDLNTTLQADQTRLVLVESSNPKVQLIGNASGGALLEFTVTRYFDRQSGGPLPLLNL